MVENKVSDIEAFAEGTRVIVYTTVRNYLFQANSPMNARTTN
jgi:hypothetical protein